MSPAAKLRPPLSVNVWPGSIWRLTPSPTLIVAPVSSVAEPPNAMLDPSPTFSVAPGSTVTEPPIVAEEAMPSESDPLITSKLVVLSVVRPEMASALFWSK